MHDHPARFLGLVAGRSFVLAAVVACGQMFLVAPPLQAAAIFGPTVFGEVSPSGCFQDCDHEFRWSFSDTDGPGIINGDRGNQLKAGADIIFNIEPALKW